MTNEFVLVSDIHGNAPALEQVVEREGRDKEYMVLGDIHGLNAYPKETQELVQEVGNFVLAGNHDKALFHHNEGHVNSDALSRFELRHTLDNLSDEQQNWMRERPFMEVVQSLSVTPIRGLRKPRATNRATQASAKARSRQSPQR